MSLILTGVCLVAFLAMLLLDKLRPARRMPEIKGPWRGWGLFFFVLTIVVNGALPYALRPWLETHHVLNGAALGDWGGAVVGFLFYELIVYWLHRAHHRIAFLWRWVHQMHHAPERMDPAGMCFFHPNEIVLLAVVSTGFYGWFLGLTPEAASLAGVFFIASGLFEHSNIRTPTWVGYFVQRPEQHGLHHQRNLHATNYSELPLWDLVFGTFKNPSAWESEAGFYDGALGHWRALMFGKNLLTPRGADAPPPALLGRATSPASAHRRSLR